MTDIPNWLRFRTRTPAGSEPTTPSQERFHFLVEQNEAELEIPRTREVSRISSFLGFSRQHIPSQTAAEPDPFSHVKGASQIWHNPSPDQMAETLKVVMMARDNFDPLPVQYNSCILQLLEAYHDLKSEVEHKDGDIDELLASHQEEIKNLKLAIQRSEDKEIDYKLEIKNLEIIIATGQRGLDLVTLARSRSRNTHDEGQNVSEQESQAEPNRFQGRWESQREEPMFLNAGLERDAHMSRKFVRPQEEDQRPSTIVVPIQIRQLQGESVTNDSNEKADEIHPDSSSFSRNDLAMRISNHLSEMDSNISSESSVHDTCRIYGQQPHYNLSPGLDDQFSSEIRTRILHDEKPLPDIPPESTSDADNASATGAKRSEGLESLRHRHDKSISSQSSHHSRGFSFVPGDDTYELRSLDSTRSQLSQSTRPTHEQVTGEAEIPRSSSLSPPKLVEEKPLPSSEPSRKATLLKRGGQPYPGGRDLIDEQPTRENSQSSIITAIQDNSRRSSREGAAQARHGEGRPKMRAYDGSNEAIIAASRALSDKEKKTEKSKSRITSTGKSRADGAMTVKDKAAQFDGMQRGSHT